MKAVILAAGKGSRLYPITRRVPKPLMPLANRMTMEYAFDRIKECGIEEVCVVVGENEPQMRESLGDGGAFDLKLDFARQGEPRGLAHAVASAQESVGGDDFLLYLGDAIYGSPIAGMAEKFRQSGAQNVNLVKHIADPRRYGIAFVEGDRITGLEEKPPNPQSNWTMAGAYVFGSRIWEVLPKLEPSARGEYEITDAIQLLVDEGDDVRAWVYEGEWYDTGTRESFLTASRFLAGDEPMIGIDADVQAELGEHVVVGRGARVLAQRIEDSVVLPDSVVEVDGEIAGSILSGRVQHRGALVDSIRDGESSG